jgi:hypothetical protein
LRKFAVGGFDLLNGIHIGLPRVKGQQMMGGMVKTKAPAPPILPLELWRLLYETSSRFQRMAPWRWMEDTHLFGVNNEHGVRVISVLGRMGEVFGLASHRGGAGIYALFQLLNGQIQPDDPENGFQQDTLLMDFATPRDLRPADRVILRQIQFQPVATKPRRIPQFYSHKPGYVPWHIDKAEGRALLDDLDKALLYAEFVRTDPDQFCTITQQKVPFFPAQTRTPLTAEQMEWHTISAPPPALDPPVEFLSKGAEALVPLPQRTGEVWELESFCSNMAIAESPRPYWARVALLVETRTGMVLECQVGHPRQTMAESAGLALMAGIKKSGRRPALVKVRSFNLAQALQPLAAALKIHFHQVATLPAFEAARCALENFSSPTFR